MGSPVVFFEILGANGRTLRQFYRELFGWSFTEFGGDGAASDYALVASNGNGIYGGVGTAPNGSPGHVTVYVATEDVAGALKRVESLGGTTTHPPMKIPGGGEIALFSDPEGHTIGLYKRAR
jgi:predicted enzyme related to lactoylglutathione lyase